MAWCVDTLKIVGVGEVERSSLCNFEFHLGYYENFLVINEDRGEVIKVVIFPQALFEQSFIGVTTIYTMHFIKYKEGRECHLDEYDTRLIAKEYNERTKKKLKLITNM